MKINDEFKKSYEVYIKTYLPDSIIQNENFKSSISESLEALAELWFYSSTHFISRGPFKPTRKLSAKLFQSMIGKISRLKDVNS
jgi:hypothetical protein